MYLHLKFLLASPEMMMKLNHKLSKNIDIEMIGQYRKSNPKGVKLTCKT